MNKVVLLLCAFGLAACGAEPAPVASAVPATPLQCAMDTDCKGERICDAGKCVNPSAQGLAVVDAAASPPQAAQAAPAAPAPAAADSALQAGLVAALRLKPGTTERMGESATAIKAYIQAGVVAATPDFRADYSDYRTVRKPAGFMGHSLLAIEEEYMAEYVGCCVSPGLSVTVRLDPAGENLETFAKGNGCSFTPDTDPYNSIDQLKLPAAKKGTYAQLNCKERDVPTES